MKMTAHVTLFYFPPFFNLFFILNLMTERLFILIYTTLSLVFIFKKVKMRKSLKISKLIKK